jgi:hypothetical protein
MLSNHQRPRKGIIKAKGLFQNTRFEHENRAEILKFNMPRIFKVEDCLKCNNSKKYYTFYDKYLHKRVSIDNFLFLFIFLLNAFFFFEIDILIEKFFD